MTYDTPFDRYVAPARAKPQLWRMAVGLAVIVLFWMAGSAGAFVAAAMIYNPGQTREAAMRWMMTTPPGVLTVLATFIGLILGVWAAGGILHRRGPGSFMGRGARVVRDFVTVAGIMLALALGLTFLTLPFTSVQQGLPLSRWLALLPLTVIGIAIQTLSEELLFRGYVLQQMAARFRGRWAWMVLPSIVFALMHGANPGIAPQTMIPMLAILFVFGLAAADLTAITGSIGASWGFHFANNFTVIAVLSSGEMLKGLALWNGGLAAGGAGTAPSPLDLISNGVLIVLVWWICRRAVRR